ncbi:MAG: Uncharacterised protein [Halieaceae bacterium]|nr:MAG: Uncharacterised protein [Halieaceae bacterium]
MSHRNRATTTDLLAKEWHNGARGAEHVAKAHNAETGLSFDLGQALQNEFRKPLGRAHHISGTNRLISRNQHKGIHARPMRRPGCTPGAVNIIGHAFSDVVLHHRHMLIRRSVVDRVHRKGAENRFEALLITHAAQKGHNGETQALPLAQTLDLTIHAVERKL